MKLYFLLLVVFIAPACGEPLKVTTKSDQQATTSGTLGSVKANNQMSGRTIDSPGIRPIDTINRRKDR